MSKNRKALFVKLNMDYADGIALLKNRSKKWIDDIVVTKPEEWVKGKQKKLVPIKTMSQF